MRMKTLITSYIEDQTVTDDPLQPPARLVVVADAAEDKFDD